MAHEGGTKVYYGFYWSAKAWDMVLAVGWPGGSRAAASA